MTAIGAEAAVSIILQVLEQKHGGNFTAPIGTATPRRLGKLPCLTRLAIAEIDVEKLKESVSVSIRLSPKPSWKDIACFMGQEIPNCLVNESDRFLCSGNMHHRAARCPFREDDLDGYL